MSGVPVHPKGVQKGHFQFLHSNLGNHVLVELALCPGRAGTRLGLFVPVNGNVILEDFRQLCASNLVETLWYGPNMGAILRCPNNFKCQLNYTQN